MPKAARMSVTTVVGLCLLAFALQAGGESIQEQTKALRVELRKTFGSRRPPLPVPANNPQTRDKVRLGEALFFDPNLSSCGTVACGTCHLPDKRFSDGDAVSMGCNGARGRRHSNTVYQGAYLSHLFWDGRVQSLEQQALNPVVDPAEMANTWENVLSYLKTGVHPGTGRSFPEAKKFYEAHFGKTFDGEISSTTAAKAIAAYERTVTSFDSPYDRWLQGSDAALSPAQKNGMVVFFGRGKCAQCHTPPHFTNSDFHNIGVPNTGYERAEQFPQNAEICGKIASNADPGRAEVPALHSSCSDVGAFKTPTLRNVALSGPYMHNGRFDTLEGALRHYEELAKGVVAPVAGELDADVRTGAMRFGAGRGAADDVANMLDFMKALTGSQISGPRGGVAPPGQR